MPFSTGQILTAAALNEATASDPTVYTPTWRASGTQPAIGNGTLVGEYIKVGKLVMVRINLLMGSTTTFGTGSYTWDLPFTAAAQAGLATQWIWIGQAFAIDAGVGYHVGMVQITTGATALKVAVAEGALPISGAQWAATVPHTWANTDFVTMQVTYKAQ